MSKLTTSFLEQVQRKNNAIPNFDEALDSVNVAIDRAVNSTTKLPQYSCRVDISGWSCEIYRSIYLFLQDEGLYVGDDLKDKQMIISWRHLLDTMC